MRKLIVAVLAALAVFAGPVSAADLQVTWTNSTTNTDGSAIPATGPGSLVSTRVEFGTCSGANFGTKAGEVVVLMPAATATISNVLPGTHCVRAFHKNTYNNESIASNVASKVVPTPVPNPPVVTVVNIAAMEMKQGQNGPWLAARVGSVPKGTLCEGDKLLASGKRKFYAVPLAQVAFTALPSCGTAKVVAECA